MASDAFFPFPDCVEIAGNEGIKVVIQPGGSIKDQLSIEVSIGVALHPYDANFDYDLLMNNADKALYEAKEAGRNTYRIFSEEPNPTIAP